MSQQPPQQSPPGGPPPGGPPPYQAPPPQQAYQPPTTPGAPIDPRTGREYSHWWKRVVAAIIDGLIINVPAYIIMALLGAGFAASGDLQVDPVTGELTGGRGFAATFIVAPLIILVIGVAYKIYFDGGERGQTVGKMAMSIQVRDEATGGSIGYGKAGLRYVVGLVLFWICFIPGVVDLLFPLWDPKRQTLHDKAANSVVIDIA